MSSVNKAILIGNLGRDPEVRHTSSGDAIVNMSLATSESWRDKTTGDRKERTEWHKVVIFDTKIGEIAQKYLRKGSKVYIEGQIQTRKWTDQSGAEKYSTEVVLNRFRGELKMLDEKGNGQKPREKENPSPVQRDDDLDDAWSCRTTCPAIPTIPAAGRHSPSATAI